MKKEIHPTAYVAAKVVCNSCQSTFEVLSTKESFDVEVCSNCHSFYTGDQRIMDTAGRAERFRKLQEKSSDIKVTAPKKATKKQEAETEAVVEN